MFNEGNQIENEPWLSSNEAVTNALRQTRGAFQFYIVHSAGSNFIHENECSKLQTKLGLWLDLHEVVTNQS